MGTAYLADDLVRGMKPSTKDVVQLLTCSGKELDGLYLLADQTRKAAAGDQVYLRGIIEFSNYCSKDCLYCGIRRGHKKLTRYRMTKEEIIRAAGRGKSSGCTTVVLQSGEDGYFTAEKLADIISALKERTGLAITVSVGERSADTYALWRQSGMDRYFMRFETSSRKLFKTCHPDGDFDHRIQCLRDLNKAGIQTGSGFLIGLPGQTIHGIADDIIFASKLDLDMIGIGPFIPCGDTPFAGKKPPFDVETYFKCVAILRLLNKKAHIPATTAFDAIAGSGRKKLLSIGANVFMPNITPVKYKKYYQLYPGKPCLDEPGSVSIERVKRMLASIGRSVGTGPGHSMKLS